MKPGLIDFSKEMVNQALKAIKCGFQLGQIANVPEGQLDSDINTANFVFALAGISANCSVQKTEEEIISGIIEIEDGFTGGKWNFAFYGERLEILSDAHHDGFFLEIPYSGHPC